MWFAVRPPSVYSGTLMANRRDDRASMLLTRVQTGDAQSSRELFDLLYVELRDMAERYLKRERSGHTLQPTALVNEAWVKLVDLTHIETCGDDGRQKFFGIAARAMRQILVDHARRRGRIKRSGGGDRITLAGEIATEPIDNETLLDLDEGMNELKLTHERLAQVAELRLFGGLTIGEIATLLGLSNATIKVDWSLARAMLSRHLRAEEA